MGKLLAIPWWSIPLFIVGMYDIYIGTSQGLVILVVTALVSLLLKVFDKKFKTLLTLPWWSVPFFGIGGYDIFNQMINPGILLLVVTSCSTGLFCYLVYRYNKQTKVICPNCNRETWKYKDGKLPTIHRSSQCKQSGFVEPRKPRGV